MEVGSISKLPYFYFTPVGDTDVIQYMPRLIDVYTMGDDDVVKLIIFLNKLTTHL